MAERNGRAKISLPRYTLWLLVFRLFVPVVTYSIYLLSGISVSLDGLLVTPLSVVLAVSIVGRRFARQTGRVATKAEARRFAVLALPRFLVVEFLVLLGAPLLFGRPDITQEYIYFLTGEYATFIWSLVGLFLLIAFLLNRWVVVFSAW
ncbi:ABZJ_00895 family protein, partial [Ruegeria sp. NA]